MPKPKIAWETAIACKKNGRSFGALAELALYFAAVGNNGSSITGKR
jgi:hypothetical protein